MSISHKMHLALHMSLTKRKRESKLTMAIIWKIGLSMDSIFYIAFYFLEGD